MFMEWDDVTKVEDLHEYIEEHIGWENVYDELYQDFIYGMIRNRESKKRLEKLMKDDGETILIKP